MDVVCYDEAVRGWRMWSREHDAWHEGLPARREWFTPDQVAELVGFFARREIEGTLKYGFALPPPVM